MARFSVRRSFVFLLSILFLFLLVGCAEGEPQPIDSTGQNSDDLSDGDGEDLDVDGDLGDDGDLNGEGDEEGDGDSEDPCSTCCPGDLRCGDDTTVEVCNEAGTAFTASPCPAGDICVDGACEAQPVCSPGDRFCSTSSAASVCRPDGMGYLIESCNASTEVCIGGHCLTGERNGEPCDMASDCAGGLCRCGSEEICIGSPTPYCASDCTLDSCTGDQVCWSSTGVVAAGYDHCLRSCDQVCSITGRACRQVPTFENGQPAWRGGCVPTNLKAVGTRCSSDAECVSGECSTTLFQDGICTHRCETKGCPSGTACVRNIRSGQSEQYWCSPRCTSAGFCPLAQSTTGSDWSVACNNRPVHSDWGGGIANVCTPR